MMKVNKFYAVLSNTAAPTLLSCLDTSTYLCQFSLQNPPSRVVVYSDSDLDHIPQGKVANVYAGAEPFLPNRPLGTLARDASAFSAPFALNAMELALASDVGTANLLLKIEEAPATAKTSKVSSSSVKKSAATKTDKPSKLVPGPASTPAPAPTRTAPTTSATKKKRSSPKTKPSTLPAKAQDEVTPPKAKRAKKSPASSKNTVSAQEVSPKSVLPMVPPPRWGHSADWYHAAKEIVIFGGSGYSGSNYNDLWTLDSITECWQLHQTTGSIPTKRMGHTSAVVGDSLFVFGGSKGNKWLNDVHELDLVSKTWTTVDTAGEGPRAAYHSATVVGRDIFIIGGVAGNVSSNKVYIFDTVAKEWSQPEITGTAPCPRSGHSTCLVDNKLVLFAGWDEPECFNDVYVLDISTMNWSQPKLSGSAPSPRTWHRACAVAESRILVFGGYNGDDAVNDLHVLDLIGETWVPLDMDAIDLHARCGHSMTPAVGRLIVFGGGNNSGGFFNDWPSITVEVQLPGEA